MVVGRGEMRGWCGDGARPCQGRCMAQSGPDDDDDYDDLANARSCGAMKYEWKPASGLAGAHLSVMAGQAGQLDGWWLDVAIYEAGAVMWLARARDGAWRSQGLLMMMVLRLPAAAELWGIGGGRHAGWLERICL